MSDKADWRRIEELFDAASALPTSAQDKYLDEHCVGQSELAARVRALLCASRDAGNFLDQTVSSAAATAWIDRQGSRLGAYRLLHEIGHGGMGRVYLAERADEQYSLKVAIKIVRGDLASPAILQRFRIERQILANLHHPGIARLLDGGATDTGTPYLVMEYVDGVSVDRFCKEQSLSIPDTLKLFRRICSAVSYAHRNLVVHRDIKPANVLVTSEGLPRLLDFGIAKVLDVNSGPIATTRQSDRVMTPEYASPEQVLGNPVAVPSDIFMLGLLLYELLSGVPAIRFTSTKPSDRERLICETDPPLPSIVGGNKKLAGDLDAIVMKAIRKEPDRRYASVEQFDNDIARWLDGLPVEARTGAWTYRASKLLRRRLVPILLASGVALIVGISAFTSLQSAHRANQAAEQSRVRLQSALAMANSSLLDIHAEVSELAGSTKARGLIVQRTLQSLADLEKNSEGDPQVQLVLAVAYEKLSDIQYRDGSDHLGDTQAAEASAKRALQLRERLQQPAAIAADLVRLGELYGHMRRDADSIEAFRSAVAKYESFPKLDRPARAALAKARGKLASILATQADVQPALEQIQLAVHDQRALLKDAPHDKSAREEIGKALSTLGEIERDQIKDFAAAFQSFNEGLAFARALAAEDPGARQYRTQLASILSNLGHTWFQRGEPLPAIAFYRESLGLVQTLAASDPNDARSNRSVAIHSTNLALALSRIGRVAQAELTFRDAIRVHETIRGKNPESFLPILDLAFAHSALGQLLLRNGNPADGRRQLEEAKNLGDALVRQDPTNSLYRLRLANVHEALGNARKLAGACPDALSHYQHAIDLLQSPAGPDSGFAIKTRDLTRKLASCKK